MKMKQTVSVEIIKDMIVDIRGHRVILDSDLASIYGVETKYLKRQVRRNINRFPSDFMFKLTKEEFLRCQKVTSKRGGRRYLPFAFTEEGVAMLSSILNSKRAVQANIAIMRAFVKLRELMAVHKALAEKIDSLEKKLMKHDKNFVIVFKAIKQLIAEEQKPKRKIGFHSDEELAEDFKVRR